MTEGSRQVRDIRAIPGVVSHQPHSMEQVEAVLRILPSHGWTAGWIGRRDRALLVLSELAGLSYETIASLTAGDLTIAGGVATIRTPGGRTTLRGVEDDLLCGPCSLARWVHALDLTVVHSDGRIIASVIGRAVPLASDSPHLCHGNNAITGSTGRAALLPPIDRWDHPVRPAVPPVAHRVHGPGRARRDLVPAQHTPRSPAAKHDTNATTARALQDRVDQLLAGSAP